MSELLEEEKACLVKLAAEAKATDDPLKRIDAMAHMLAVFINNLKGWEDGVDRRLDRLERRLDRLESDGSAFD